MVRADDKRKKMETPSVTLTKYNPQGCPPTAVGSPPNRRRFAPNRRRIPANRWAKGHWQVPGRRALGPYARACLGCCGTPKEGGEPPGLEVIGGVARVRAEAVTCGWRSGCRASGGGYKRLEGGQCVSMWNRTDWRAEGVAGVVPPPPPLQSRPCPRGL